MQKIDDKIFIVSTIVLAAASIGLGIYGIVSPPPGEVHPSVLQLIDKMWRFLAIIELYLLIRKGRGFKYSIGKLNVEATPDDKKDEEGTPNEDNTNK